MKTETTATYCGIDYGCGRTNINRETGIRYGVIPSHAIGQAWYDKAEPDYGDPTCPKCGNQAVKRHTVSEQLENGVAIFVDDESRESYEPYHEHGFNEYACDVCKLLLDSDSVWGDEPLSTNYESDGYVASEGSDADIFVTDSPYFTYAQFCSPCAPGACYLLKPLDEPVVTNRAYCFGHEWFEDGKAPYPVYSVKTGEIVKPE